MTEPISTRFTRMRRGRGVSFAPLRPNCRLPRRSLSSRLAPASSVRMLAPLLHTIPVRAS